MRLDAALSSSLIEHYRLNSAVFEPMRQLPSVPQLYFGGYDTEAAEEVDELASLLLSTSMATDPYRMISLGAAPGEWAIRAERAFNSRFPQGDFHACCIEGDLDHINMTTQFVAMNGGDPDLFDIRHAVIADQDGYAYFPVINPAIDWGAGVAALAQNEGDLSNNISINELDVRDRVAANDGKPIAFRTVTALSLSSLLADLGIVDYLHSDIQGAERIVFPTQMDVLDEHVRICCISTHARSIEPLLSAAFASHGWMLLAAHRCHTIDEGELERVVKDGIFIWVNPRLLDPGMLRAHA